MSDPAHPVPFIDYIATAVPQRYMVDDQRFASRRPDVLVYQSEPLEEDVTIAGPVSPKLSVASSGTDSDFVVKLIDVYPNDFPTMKQRMRRSEYWARRQCMGAINNCCAASRWRQISQLEKPEALIPGKIAQLDF